LAFLELRTKGRHLSSTPKISFPLGKFKTTPECCQFTVNINGVEPEPILKTQKTTTKKNTTKITKNEI